LDSYTLTGRQSAVNHNGFVTDYIYDGRDRVITTTNSNGIVGYEYDPNGNRSKLKVKAGSSSSFDVTDYVYDAANQLKEVNNAASNTYAKYDYLGTIRRSQMSVSSSLGGTPFKTTEFLYDDYNRAKGLIHRNSSGNTIASYEYTLGAAGNKTAAVEFDGTTTTNIAWTYNDSYRLKQEVRTGGQSLTTNWTYDAVGNRETMAVTQGGNTTNFTYSYNTLDQLTQATVNGTPTNYGYDTRGNLTTVGGVQTYGFDAQNRLITATVTGGGLVQFTYDGKGQRTKLSYSGVITNYLWDEQTVYGDVVAETNSSGAVQTSYLIGGSCCFSLKELISQKKGSVTGYFLHDGQGSVRGLIDSTGTNTDKYTFNAYGELTNSSGAIDNSYRYTGQQFDALTGLYSLRARYYSPGLGRFLSRDTMEFGLNDPTENNRYNYARSNPVSYSDPSGNNALAEWKAMWQPLAVAMLAFLGSFLVIQLLKQLDLDVTLPVPDTDPDPDDTPAPEPKPDRDPVPPVPDDDDKKCKRHDTEPLVYDETFCLALGLDDYPFGTHNLAVWAHPRNYTLYTDIFGKSTAFFVTRIKRLMDKAGQIHFNMEGIDPSLANGKLDPLDSEQPIGGYTNYELWLADNFYSARTIKHPPAP
jgi:RHS repeat-associated protein